MLALVGPTAAGKSALAMAIAPQLGAEIVSVDSTMVYVGMDIGTDKPSPAELARVPHHMVDVVEPSRTMTVADFQTMARRRIEEVLSRGRTSLLVGGSGLYFRAVVDPLEFPGTDPRLRAALEGQAQSQGAEALHRRLAELDPEAAARIERSNLRRLVRALEVIALTGRPFSSFRVAWDLRRSIYALSVAGLSWPRPELDRRIDARVDAQIAGGLVDEVLRLEDAGWRASRTSV
ncbi:MAG: tRNA (adenosine(37)-N6)-dimethylallyltransferase MiaA, partial [Candidatus Methylomirabilales bacterium]